MRTTLIGKRPTNKLVAYIAMLSKKYTWNFVIYTSSGITHQSGK